MTRAVLIAILNLCSIYAFAATLKPPTLEWAAVNSDVVVRAQVISAQTYMFENGGRKQACGIAYKAALREVVRGELDHDAMTFVSHMQLAAGVEYLLFMSARSETSAWASEHRIPDPGHAGAKDRKECVARLPNSQWTASYSFRFYDSFRDKKGEAPWLEKDMTSPRLPDGVKTMKLKCDSDVTEGCGSVSEPVLIEWLSLKALLADGGEDNDN